MSCHDDGIRDGIFARALECLLKFASVAFVPCSLTL